MGLLTVQGGEQTVPGTVGHNAGLLWRLVDARGWF